ncbi:MAG: GNAT family N-acetyltransferase [Parvularculaceae bacterium]
MADGGDSPHVSTHRGLGSISPAVWNGCAGVRDPFVSHEFLSALEVSGSVGAETGWTPAHLLLEGGGALLGCAPVYLKTHSFGEYVFDHHWAEAFERAGGRYYPRLVCAAPFSPVPGPRLLAETATAKSALAAALIATASEASASSVHVNFVESCDEAALVAAGFLPRRGLQYHWSNRGYGSYEDFLAALSARKRKQIRRERKEAAAGVEIRRLRGAEISARYWDAFWDFYQDTGSRKWGRPYLTRDFFTRIAASMSERLLLIVAERAGEPIAGALNFIGDDALYGRYWGCTEERPFLHFELCYHQAIEFAIEAGLARVEAGAQGEHKIARGYEPVATRSAHWIADPPFRRAIEKYLTEERTQVAAQIEALRAETPFRREQ